MNKDLIETAQRCNFIVYKSYFEYGGSSPLSSGDEKEWRRTF